MRRAGCVPRCSNTLTRRRRRSTRNSRPKSRKRPLLVGDQNAPELFVPRDARGCETGLFQVLLLHRCGLLAIVAAGFGSAELREVAFVPVVEDGLEIARHAAFVDTGLHVGAPALE